jgi:FkbM family methyltransferase
MEAEAERNIYSRLCDEESRRVFDVRRHYALTGEKQQFADVFVNRKQLMELAERVKGKTYICYGLGHTGRALIKYFDTNGCGTCVGLWDNNVSLQGEYIGEHLITAPDYELIKSANMILITAARAGNAESIALDLVSKGAPQDKIVSIDPHGQALGNCVYALYEQYFDENIILPRLLENEVFIDAGCGNFDQGANLLKFAPSVKRIYAFEPDPENMQSVLSHPEYVKAQDKTKLYDCALWSANETLDFWVSDFNKGLSGVDEEKANMQVEGRKLDDIVLPEDKVTFIKMDIEGAELEALKGASKIIERDKPKIAVSIYHKKDDYVDIAGYLLTLVPEYKLYMRHYTPFRGESVLYCVL